MEKVIEFLKKMKDNLEYLKRLRKEHSYMIWIIENEEKMILTPARLKNFKITNDKISDVFDIERKYDIASKRKFWKLEAVKYARDESLDEFEWVTIYYGTFYEAAREVIQENDGSREDRSIEPFKLPPVDGIDFGFYAL